MKGRRRVVLVAGHLHYGAGLAAELGPGFASSHCSSATAVNSCKALRNRELGADLDLLVPRQPHLRLSHRRARSVAAGGISDPGRPTSTPTSATRRFSPPASTGS